MILTGVMIGVVLILVTCWIALRQARQRQSRLESETEAMQMELDRHRRTVQSILRELQNL